MSDPLQELKQAIAAHQSFGSLANYYMEVNPALYAELVADNPVGIEQDIPIFNTLNDPPVLIANLYILQDTHVQYWQCVNALTGEVIKYPHCAELIRTEIDSQAEVSRHVV
jgi:hypothetical protein